MGILARMFGSKTQDAMPVQPSGLVENEARSYYEESQDYSNSHQTIQNQTANI